MLERVLNHWPSFLGALILIVAGLIYLKITIRQIGRDHLKDQSWVLEHADAVVSRVTLPMTTLVVAPFEELLCRGPLLLFFPRLSTAAWIGISLSTLLFVALHWEIPRIAIFSNPDNPQPPEDVQHKLRYFRLGISLLIGLLAGIFAIHYQSLWLAIGIHGTLNAASLLLGYLITRRLASK